MTCRTILRRLRPAHHVRHVLHVRHVHRAHWIASVVCSGGIILGSAGAGFAAGALAGAWRSAPAVATETASAPASWTPGWWDAHDCTADHHCTGPIDSLPWQKPTNVPEPGTLAVLAAGLVALAGVRRRA